MRLLHIDSSPDRRGVTRSLGADFVRDLAAAVPGATLVHRDLAASPPAQVDEGWITAAFGKGEAPGALDESDALVDEMVAADVIVLGAPMHNFTVPATLKAWLDQVIRPGRTFTYESYGPRGLATGKRVVLLTASAGDYGPDSPLAFMNFLEPYMRAVLGFMGMTDVTVVRVHGYDDAARAPSLAEARARLATLVSAIAAAAAAAGRS